MKFHIEKDAFGSIFYYLNNLLHRDDGPAVEYFDGTKCWFKNDKLHRDNGPAIEYANGTKEWYKNGKLHRTDGPAIQYSDGSEYWYLNNICYGYNSDFSSHSWISFVNTFIFS